MIKDKEKGAITVFLCILLSAMVALTGILTDAARIKASGVLAREAAESSSRSLLADYNRVLKDYYGLFALENSNEDDLVEGITEFINKTLMTELGVSKVTMGENFYNKLLNMFLGSNPINEKAIFDLYDFQLEEMNVKPIYSLAQKEVLNRQIIEQVKYRAPAEVVEKLWDKFSPFKSFGKQSNLIDKKMKIDNDLDKAKDTQEDLSDNIEKINSFDSLPVEEKLSFLANKYNSNIEERLNLEDKIPIIEADITSLKSKLKSEQKSLDSLYATLRAIAEANSRLGEGATPIDTSGIAASIRNVKDNISKLNSQLNLKQEELVDIKNKIRELSDSCFEIKSILNERLDDLQNELKNATNNISNLKIIGNSISGKINDLKEKELKGENSDFATQIKMDLNRTTSKLSLNKLNEVLEGIKSNKNVADNLWQNVQVTGDELIDVNKLNSLLREYTGNINANAINYKITKPIINANVPDVREATKSFEEKAKNELQNNLSSQNSSNMLSDSDLMSKTSITEDNFLREDLKYIKTYIDTNFNRQNNQMLLSADNSLDSSEIKNILNGFDSMNKESLSFSKSFSFINDIGSLVTENLEDLRDKAYLDYYIQNIFKSRLTKNTNSQSTPEKDLFGNIKDKRETYFESEIEYIIAGTKDERVNNTIVEGQLILIRFVLNTLAIYSDPTKYSDAYLAATAIAGFTVLGVPIIQNLIMIGWAFAEAIIDVKMLVQGKEVPLYKTNGTWVLDKTSAIKGIVGEAVKDTSNVIIDYGRDKAQSLARSATSKVEEIIKGKIDIAVDKAFSPVDRAFNTSNEYLDSFNDVLSVNIDENISGDLKEIVKLVEVLANQEYSNIGDTLIETLRNCTVEEGEEKLQEVKSDVRNRIYKQIEGLKSEIDKKIVTYIDKGADELKKYVDSLDTGVRPGNSQGKLTTCLISMNYKDYLSLLILINGRDTVLPRVADLIQLNMRGEDSNFDLSKSFTYVRVDGKVSVKYIFWGSMVKDNAVSSDFKPRFTNNILLYQGY